MRNFTDWYAGERTPVDDVYVENLIKQAMKTAYNAALIEIVIFCQENKDITTVEVMQKLLKIIKI